MGDLYYVCKPPFVLEGNLISTVMSHHVMGPAHIQGGGMGTGFTRPGNLTCRPFPPISSFLCLLGVYVHVNVYFPLGGKSSKTHKTPSNTISKHIKKKQFMIFLWQLTASENAGIIAALKVAEFIQTGSFKIISAAVNHEGPHCLGLDRWHRHEWGKTC